jgi:CoA:oxalate CoA-transferase
MPTHDPSGLPVNPVTGPLSGIVVLDLTRVVAGPYCAMMLADLGASVIKIECPSEPDFVRTFPPMVAAADEMRSGFFAQYNRHKFGITLDLKAPGGCELFLEMVRKADILIENFRPGTMKRMGLDFETLHVVNPRLVYTAISGFGQTGPNSARPAFDNSAQATGGLWSMNGAPGEPQRVGTVIGDLAASLYAAFGTLAALRQAEISGLGQMVDISQQDSVVTLTENAVVNYTAAGIVAEPIGNHHPFVRPYGCYACRDGHVFMGAYTDKFWREACSAFDQPALASDPEIDSMEKRFVPEVYERRVRPIVESWCADRTKQELEALAADRFPLSPIKNIAEVVADPHLAARGMLMSVDYGATQSRVFASAVHLSSLTPARTARAPLVGEHNEAIYAEWLAIDPGRLERLRAGGVI